MTNKIKPADKKSLDILHFALTGMTVLMGGVIYYLMLPSDNFIYSSNSLFFIIAAVAVLAGIFIGTKIYNTNINNAAKRTFDSYEEAIMNFRSANLIKWCMVEGTSLMGIVLAFLDHNPFIFFPVMSGVFYLFVSKMKEEHFNHYRYNKDA